MPTWLGIDIGSASMKAAVVRSAYRKMALVRLGSAEVGRGRVVDAVRAGARRRRSAGETPQPDAMAVAIEGARAAIHRLILPATAQSSSRRPDVRARGPGALRFRRAPCSIGACSSKPRRRRAARPWSPPWRASTTFAPASIWSRRPSWPGARAGGRRRLHARRRSCPYVPCPAEGGTVAVVDLGAKASDMLVLENGEPVFARTLSTGTEGLPATADRLARDIRVSFAAHRAQGGDAPTRVYLCGGGAFVSGAEGFLSASLEIPVQVLPEPAVDSPGSLPSRCASCPATPRPWRWRCRSPAVAPGMNLRRGPLSFERGLRLGARPHSACSPGSRPSSS